MTNINFYSGVRVRVLAESRTYKKSQPLSMTLGESIGCGEEVFHSRSSRTDSADHDESEDFQKVGN